MEIFPFRFHFHFHPFLQPPNKVFFREENAFVRAQVVFFLVGFFYREFNNILQPSYLFTLISPCSYMIPLRMFHCPARVLLYRRRSNHPIPSRLIMEEKKKKKKKISNKCLGSTKSSTFYLRSGEEDYECRQKYRAGFSRTSTEKENSLEPL